MKLLLPLLALTALLGGAAPAAAEQRLATEAAPFTADAYGGVIAWSSFDTASETYRLRLLRDGAPVTPATVAPSTTPFDLDVGPGPDGAPLVVYSRGGDIFQYDPATGLEQPLAEVNTPNVEERPSINRSALGFVRRVHGRPNLYLRKGGDTRKQPRPRFHRTLAIEDVELTPRGLFVVYRSDVISGSCCTAATLYRVAGGKLRHIFEVPSGGANFGQIVTPSVAGGVIYFGRTNEGSGQGNNFFRYDLRSRRLFAARGTSRARSLTWRGDRFLMSRDSDGCQGPPDIDPTATQSCELLLTDPIRFTRASRADQRRTRP